jgi:thioredoxin reductase (NADPH)
LKSLGASIVEAEGAPVLDPETFESSVPGLYVIGGAVAGKQSGKIFIENGRFHGGVAIAAIAKTRQKA